MDYKYEDREPKVGDAVLWKNSEHPILVLGAPYIVSEVDGIGRVKVIAKGLEHDKFGPVSRKVIKTLPGSEAKVGDTIIRAERVSFYSYSGGHIPGKLETVTAISLRPNKVITLRIESTSTSIHSDDCRVLVKEEAKSITEFNYDLIMQPKTVVHCPTEEQAIDLLAWATSKDLEWKRSGTYENDTRYENHMSNTCYNLYNGRYSRKDYWGSQGYKILTFEEVKLPTISTANPCSEVELKDSIATLSNLYELDDGPVPFNLNQPTEGSNMSITTEDLTTAVTAGILAATTKTGKVKKAKTDFQLRKPITATFYERRSGKFITKDYFNTVGQADEALKASAAPHQLKMVISAEVEIVKTKTPLVRSTSK